MVTQNVAHRLNNSGGVSGNLYVDLNTMSATVTEYTGVAVKIKPILESHKQNFKL